MMCLLCGRRIFFTYFTFIVVNSCMFNSCLLLGKYGRRQRRVSTDPVNRTILTRTGRLTLVLD